MSEQPPPLPEPTPDSGTPKQKEATNLGFFLGMILAGIGLFLLCVLFCYYGAHTLGMGALLPLFAAALGSLVTVFFKGFRGIFFGFFFTLGLLALLLTAICFGLVTGLNTK